ncbi:SDR family oxidoreductase [Candidatus Parcubacteria bacterium]|nr:SDR family oxidoreductase [Candidatus Parcubacteria bacterium]
MKIDFGGKTALVTGGTRGIGAAIAELLAESGARVIVTGSRPESKARLPKGVELRFEAVDFLDHAAAESFAKRMAKERIDILINNAGINRINAVGDIRDEDWNDILAVNLSAPMILCRALAPKMAERRFGRIVNITSVFGVVSRAQRGSYSASKFALTGLTRALALDYAGGGVLANALAPGFIDTELTRSILSEEQRREFASQTPLGRLGSAEEIARAAAFLASEANTFITGQCIVADGGYTSV